MNFTGLSAQFKAGITTSDAQGESYPLYNFGLRYAKAFNNKFAFKVNFSILDAQDWIGNDYVTDVNRPESNVNLSGSKHFDGLNLYGDEINLPVTPWRWRRYTEPDGKNGTCSTTAMRKVSKVISPSTIVSTTKWN